MPVRDAEIIHIFPFDRYKIIRSCWHIDPEQRPPFNDLALKWEKMLGDGVEYLDLTPNVIHNRSYFCTADTEGLKCILIFFSVKTIAVFKIVGKGTHYYLNVLIFG